MFFQQVTANDGFLKWQNIQSSPQQQTNDREDTGDYGLLCVEFFLKRQAGDQPDQQQREDRCHGRMHGGARCQ
jgi:hypothetical protein